MNHSFTRVIFSICLFLGIFVSTSATAQCNSSFTFAQVTNTFTAEFVDNSTSPGGVVTSWLWEFGDGTSSTLQNPHHTFTSAGTFHVCLSIHDNQGCTNQVCHDIIIAQGSANCHSAFNFAQISNSLAVEFVDLSTTAGPAAITSWLWNFGDGTTSTEQNPHHTFTHDGTFHVCLITHDNQGCVSDVCHDVVVNPVPSSCHSAYTFAQIANTLTVDFTDASTTANTMTNWQWNFGDGTSSTDQNPHHTFTHDGTFHVCLITHDSQGCVSDVCHDVVVTGTGVPVSCHALYTISNTNNPFEIHFTDASTSPNTVTSWLWDFGDGSSSHDQNITHTYTHDGIYHVCLTIHDNQGCTSTYCHEITIQHNPIACHAQYSFHADSTGTIHFTNTTTGTTAHTVYSWNFGDGTSSTSENPHHQFDHPGHYTVCLFIQDSTTGCESHFCHSIENNQRNSHALVSQYYFVNNDGSTITLDGEQYIVGYPNPFRTSMTIQYELTNDAVVKIDIMDRNGRRMRQVLNESQSAGQHTQTINAGSLSSGLYFLKMNVGGENFQKKIMIIK
ncbi:MAG: PKD domain-containing protein [Ferruginibacter sp.]